MNNCRACLSFDNIVPTVDDNFIAYYNKLTDLEVHKEDGMTQCFCSYCVGIVKNFVLFREKCQQTEDALQSQKSSIKSETEFDEVLKNKVNQLTEELQTAYGDDIVKNEVKLELDEDKDDLGVDELWWPDANGINSEELKTKILLQPPREFKHRKAKKRPAKTKTIKNKKEKVKEKRNIVFECGLCELTSTNETEVNTHLETHKTSDTCEKCAIKFPHWPGLLGHRLKHLSVEAKCHLCLKYSYRTPASLEYHYLTLHYSGQDKFLQCGICGRIYDTPKKLRLHEAALHGNMKFQCDYCQKWFRSKTNIVVHIRSHESLKQYVCDLCGFRCNQQSGLRVHKIGKHSAERVYCPNCKRLLADSNELTKHLKKCKKVMSVCDVCGKEMNNPRTYLRHIRSHESSGRYSCARAGCNAVFKTRPALTVHRDKHDNNPRRQCPYCPRKFFSSSVLTKHKRIHTGEKPYVCVECGKGFTGNHNLKVHMKIHGQDLVVKKNQATVENATKKDIG